MKPVCASYTLRGTGGKTDRNHSWIYIAGSKVSHVWLYTQFMGDNVVGSLECKLCKSGNTPLGVCFFELRRDAIQGTLLLTGGSTAIGIS